MILKVSILNKTLKVDINQHPIHVHSLKREGTFMFNVLQNSNPDYLNLHGQ